MTSPTAQIFVSSTWLDLQPEREALEEVAQRIRDVKFVGMEYFGSRDETTRRASLDEVDRSHLYIGIFAGRYGSGITEAEYRRAREKGQTCHIYFKAESSITLDKYEKKQKQRSQLNKLKAELLKAHAVTYFDSPKDLAAKVTTDLHRWLDEGWFPKAIPQEAVPTVNALHQLPSPPRDFTGRKDEYDELIRALEQSGVTIFGLQGLGGIGKTTLALKLAQQLTPRYPDAQFYLDLKGLNDPPLPVTAAMAHVIRAYQPTIKLPEAEAELSALYRTVLYNQRALLLMDNAANRKQVEPLIPSESCVMLVTSRQQFSLPGMLPKNLYTLPAEDARNLLLRIAPRIGAQADTLAELCGHLPLALRLAASALAEQVTLSVANYMRRLTDTKQRLEVLDEVEASLSLSYELLSPEMQARWRVLVVFPDTFDAAAAAAVWEIEADAAQDSLGELFKYSLLKWDDIRERYRQHDLVRLFAESKLSEAERDKAQRKHASHYLGMVREANKLYRQGGEELRRGIILFDLEWRNIQAGQAWAEAYHVTDDEAASLCSAYSDVGSYLLDIRLYPRERLPWLESALKSAQRLKKRVAEGTHLGNLGNAHWRLGEVPRAIELYNKQLALAGEIQNRRIEGAALQGLGWAYTTLKETKLALEFYQKAAAINHEIGNRRTEGNILLGLGNIYFGLEDTERAIDYYQQALKIALEIGDRRNESNALGSLASAYEALGDLDSSLKSYEQSLAIAREIGSRRGESNTLWNLSLLFDKLGKRDEAIAYAEDALKVKEQIEAPNVVEVRRRLEEWRAKGEEGGAEK